MNQIVRPYVLGFIETLATEVVVSVFEASLADQARLNDTANVFLVQLLLCLVA